MIWYLAHPLSGDIPGNTASVRRWLRALIDLEPHAAFCCPWLPYVDVLDDGIREHRERGLRDTLRMVPLCGGIVLTGGRISPGMRLELDLVEGVVSDLTSFSGPEAMTHLIVSPLEYGMQKWAERRTNP